MFGLSRRARRARRNHTTRLRRKRLRLQHLEVRRLLTVAPSFDPFAFAPLETVDISASTAHKPQSKVWQHDNNWWSVLPESSGTWLWRLDAATWNPVVQISDDSGVHTDVKADGDLVHVLLFNDQDSQFRSLEYIPGAQPTYQPWSAYPGLVDLSLSGGVESATFDIDSTGRLWVASDVTNTVEVRYADAPYSSFSAPITVATGITSDDIATIAAFGNDKVGVFWSDQNTERFGFRYHTDGSDPNVWSADEMPVLESMSSTGGGLADDHVNLATSADGTIYAAVKTGFDSSDWPQIGLLVRHPDGAWDPIYEVDDDGTRPIVVVSDAVDRVYVFYVESASGGDILYRESALDEISFTPIQTLLTGNLNNPSSTKDALTNELLVIASKGSTGYGKLVSLNPSSSGGSGNPEENQEPSVFAGIDQTIEAGTVLQLDGFVSDDGLPGPPSSLTTQWTVVSGPSIASFTDSTSPQTSVTFLAPGEYVLRLTADDGEFATTDDVTVQVTEAGTDPVDPIAGLVGYWNMDDINGSQVGDGSQLQNDGTLQGNPQLIPGTYNDGLRLDGSGDYVTVANDESLNLDQQLTLSVWVQPEKKKTQYVLKKAEHNNIDGYEISLSGSGKIFARFNQDSSGNSYRIDSTSSYPTNGQTWVHVAATYDGSTIRLYVDGQLESSKEASFLVSSNSLDLTIGAGADGDRSMKGGIDEVRIYDQALDDDQIMSLFNLEAPDVNPVVNEAPVVSAGQNQSVDVGVGLQLAGTASDDGLPTSPGGLAIDWTVVSGPGSTQFDDSSSLQATATFSAPGDYVLRLSASDGQYVTTDDVEIEVIQSVVNAAPIVSAGTDQSVEVGSQLQLQGSVSDDGLPSPPSSVTTQWTVVSGPGSVSFEDSSAVQTEVTFDTPGDYVLRLNANDGELSTTDDVNVLVTPTPVANVAPQVDAGTNQSVEAGTALQLQGLVTDDGLPNPPAAVTTQWTVISGPGNASFDDSTSPTTNVTFDAPGNYVLLLSADDGEISESDSITINVTPVVVPNTAPTVNAGADESVESGIVVQLQGTVTDDGLPNPPAAVTTQWTVVSGPGTVDFADASAVQTSASFTTAGQYVLSLTADDGEFVSTDDVIVEVTEELDNSVSGAVGYWKLDDIATGDVVDYSGMQNNGAVEGDPSALAGVLNGAIELNSSSDYVVIPDSPSLDAVDQITLAVWVRPESRKTQTVIKKAHSSDVDGYELSLSGSGKSFVRFNQDSSGNDYRLNSSSSYPTDGQTWTHLVATYDGTTIRMYVDGVLENSENATFQIATNNLGVGIGADDQGDRHMKGGIDEVQIFDRALSDSEVQSLFNLEPPTSEPPVNTPPQVDAGQDRTIDEGVVMQLAGIVSDDGLPSSPGNVTTQWTVISGPGSANFSDSSDPNTDVSFTVIGEYVLRLTANDGEQAAFDDMVVEVTEETVGPEEPTAGLVGHWKLDDISSGTAIDHSGQGNTGTLMGNSEQIVGPVDDGIRVDGSGDYVIVSDDDSLDISEQITLAAWIRPETNKTQDIIKKGHHRQVSGYELGLANSGAMFVRFNQSSSNSHRVNSETDYPTDGQTWVHLAATYDGTTIRLYVNGQLEGEKEADFQIATNDLPLTIGSEHTGFRSMKGGIDDVRVYNQALTAQEIQALATTN